MSSPLYLGSEYLDGFYGDTLAAATALTPLDLQFYRTTTDNVYVVHWSFTEAAYVPGLKKLTYELQLDTVDTFNSGNLQTFSLATVQSSVLTNTTADIFSTNTIGRSTLSLGTSLLIGNIVQIVSGTGVGQLRRIISNTSTTFTVEFAWSINPDSTSVFIVYQSNVQSYQNGNEAKGYQIAVPSRTINPKENLFVRVRTLSGVNVVSPYSVTLSIQLLDRYDLVEAENLINNLPDYHIYNKNIVKLPEAQRVTLLWKIMKMYGLELDRALLLKELVRTDNYISLTRDEQLFANFGTFFNFIKPTSMQPVDYRRCLQALIAASFEGSTDEAILTIVRCFTGVSCTIETIRDIADFFLTTILEQFTTSGTTNTYQFNQALSFVANSLVLVRDGSTTHALLTPGLDYQELDTLPGFKTTVTDPSGVTLTAFYDIAEPSPILFDPTDGLTFSGVIGLTNGDIDVFGTGTSFNSNLNIGDQITDGQVWSTVQFISDNAHLTLTESWPGDSELIPLKKLRYTDVQIPPRTVWDAQTEAFGVLLTIFNPAQFTLDRILIEQLIGLILPAHVKALFVFP